jgi:hypothetical protein
MTKTLSHRSLTIASIDRMKSSTNGNPRYMIGFTNGLKVPTKTDAGCAYAIDSSWVGQHVDVFTEDFRGKDQISGITTKLSTNFA